MVLRDRLVSLVSRVSLCSVLLTFFGSFKISLIVGSMRSFFSLTSLTTPLAGVGFDGLLTATAVTVIRFCFRLAIGVRLGWHLFAFTVPGWGASCYWALDMAITRVMLPLICMVLFIAHPVGYHVIPYALYWLIPIALYYVPSRTTFTNALGATFTAHAVGSVIWLYSIPTTPSLWYQLIPLVALERLCFALGMSLVSILSGMITKRFEAWQTRGKIMSL